MRHGIRILLVGLLGALSGTSACYRESRPEVVVSLDDGQRLVGTLTTPSFSLQTVVGEVAFDASEAGELGLLDDGAVEDAGGRVRLWLRNGSEFVGDWQSPSVAMTLYVGGTEVQASVPIPKLRRMQFQGRPITHSQALFRVQTMRGDDIYVDADTSRIRLATDVGDVAPFLSEIAVIERRVQGTDGWRVVLRNGMELHGKIQPGGVEVNPSLGPKGLKLEPASVARLERAAAPTTDLASDASGRFYTNENQAARKRQEAIDWQSMR